jgi:phosphate transport system ATP-binding protein
MESRGTTDMTEPSAEVRTSEQPEARAVPLDRAVGAAGGTATATAATPTVQAKAIEVRDLDIYYGSFHAVRSVSMTIQPNKVTALIGSSGCGKSTFLRSLNRMHELVRGAYCDGTVELDGRDIYAGGTDPVAVRRQIGMVFQQPNPFPTMSIYDNVAAGLRLNRSKLKGKALDEIVERALRGAHLWNEVKDRLDKPGSSLSGGQQQRLCIARATAVEPDVLLMDEPCSALDPIATVAIENLIAELKNRYTIAIVTHNMQQAARASDYTAFFNIDRSGDPGQLVELDDTEKIFSRPANPATEAYISGRFG